MKWSSLGPYNYVEGSIGVCDLILLPEGVNCHIIGDLDGSAAGARAVLRELVLNNVRGAGSMTVI
jgi:hypothetical protein